MRLNERPIRRNSRPKRLGWHPRQPSRRLKKHDDDKLPVIELGTSSYDHPAYREVFIPVFRIVGWKSEAELMGGDAANDDTAEVLDDDIPF